MGNAFNPILVMRNRCERHTTEKFSRQTGPVVKFTLYWRDSFSNRLMVRREFHYEHIYWFLWHFIESSFVSINALLVFLSRYKSHSLSYTSFVTHGTYQSSIVTNRSHIRWGERKQILDTSGVFQEKEWQWEIYGNIYDKYYHNILRGSCGSKTFPCALHNFTFFPRGRISVWLITPTLLRSPVWLKFIRIHCYNIGILGPFIWKNSKN